MPFARVVDIGWAMARIELTEGKPLITLCWPATDDESAGSVELFDKEGIRRFATALYNFMDELEVEDEASIADDAKLG